jgi:hypothetical protein
MQIFFAALGIAILSVLAILFSGAALVIGLILLAIVFLIAALSDLKAWLRRFGRKLWAHPGHIPYLLLFAALAVVGVYQAFFANHHQLLAAIVLAGVCFVPLIVVIHTVNRESLLPPRRHR